MPVLPNRKALTKVEEGEIVKLVEPMFDYFVVSNKQLQRLAEAAMEAAGFYNRTAETLFGPMQAMFKMQEKIASQVVELSKMCARIFENISFVIPIPPLDPSIFRQLTAIPIYIQPDEPYVPIKQLPGERKKKELPLSAIEIVGNGFTIEGEYVRGLTLKSQTGKLLELMVRKDLQGSIPDDLIGKATDKDPTDYQAWGNVFRDLKDILIEKNKLKIDLERYPGIKRYQIKGLTKYLRKPRKFKRVKNTARIN